jgi:DNA-binding transcriptional regulator YhcF (GntR family)
MHNDMEMPHRPVWPLGGDRADGPTAAWRPAPVRARDRTRPLAYDKRVTVRPDDARGAPIRGSSLAAGRSGAVAGRVSGRSPVPVLNGPGPSDWTSNEADYGLSLEPASPVPLYYQIANVLQSSIHAGLYPPGSLLGTEKELAETFGVSRITVRKAIELLHAEGLLRSRVGRGTFVTDTGRPYAPVSYHGFLDDFLARSDRLRTLEVEHGEVPAPAHVAEALGLVPGTTLMRIQRRVQGPKPDSPKLWVVYFLPMDIWRGLHLGDADLREVRILRCIESRAGRGSPGR